jgi:hypothetical protein
MTLVKGKSGAVTHTQRGPAHLALPPRGNPQIGMIGLNLPDLPLSRPPRSPQHLTLRCCRHILPNAFTTRPTGAAVIKLRSVPASVDVRSGPYKASPKGIEITVKTYYNGRPRPSSRMTYYGQHLAYERRCQPSSSSTGLRRRAQPGTAPQRIQ